MTKLLLDTHIWLWSVGDSSKLSTKIASELASESNEIWLSPVSLWELQILREKKRIAVEESFDEQIARFFQALPIREAYLTFEVVHEMNRLAMSHRDPADRLLAATAKAFDLTLVTSDQRLLDVPGLSVLAN